MLLKVIILHMVDQINGERSKHSIYPLLVGKQSIQTIQDAHLFQLTPFYSLLKRIDRSIISSYLEKLSKDSLVEEVEGDCLINTAKGRDYLKQSPLKKFYWNGIEFHQIDYLFYKRLMLFIQVWTNSSKKNSRYIPIVDDKGTLRWAKQFYYKEKRQVREQLYQLYEEMIKLFSKLNPIYPQIFIRQLTTVNSIGLTNKQIAMELNRSEMDVFLLQQNYVHFMLAKLSEINNEFPLLSEIAKDLFITNNRSTLTQSATKTLALLQQGLNLEEIAKRRRLKINTIYDHVVDIAINDKQFSINSFVSEKELETIINVVQKLESFKLKDIKSQLDDSISYFQIRLALTRLND